MTHQDLDESLPDQFRMAMQHMASSVTIITASWQGRRTGLVATAVTSLSTQPPSLLICVNQSSRSVDYIRKSGRFVVNVLAEDTPEIVEAFASKEDKEEQFLRAGNWRNSSDKLPILNDALMAIKCRVEDWKVMHTHVVFFGRVETIQVNPGKSPLIYAYQNFYRLSGLSSTEARG